VKKQKHVGKRRLLLVTDSQFSNRCRF